MNLVARSYTEYFCESAVISVVLGRYLCLQLLLDVLSAVGLTPGGSSTVHIYTQTVHRTTQLIWEECGLCPIFVSYTLAFALQLRKMHGKTSVRVAKECQLA